MTTDTDPDEKTLEKALSPAEADAFARVCRYGDKMLGYGILICMSAIATGFGFQLAWWPLAALGSVLVLTFAAVFQDARKQANAASAQSDELAFVMSLHGGDSAGVPAVGGEEVLMTAPDASGGHDAGSQAA